MVGHPNIHRPQNGIDEKCVERTRETISRTMQVLRDNPKPDTFAGRKTQEPFLQDGDEVRFQGWLNSKELRPPE